MKCLFTYQLILLDLLNDVTVLLFLDFCDPVFTLSHVTLNFSFNRFKFLNEWIARSQIFNEWIARSCVCAINVLVSKVSAEIFNFITELTIIVALINSYILHHFRSLIIILTSLSLQWLELLRSSRWRKVKRLKSRINLRTSPRSIRVLMFL